MKKINNEKRCAFIIGMASLFLCTVPHAYFATATTVMTENPLVAAPQVALTPPPAPAVVGTDLSPSGPSHDDIRRNADRALTGQAVGVGSDVAKINTLADMGVAMRKIKKERMSEIEKGIAALVQHLEATDREIARMASETTIQGGVTQKLVYRAQVQAAIESERLVLDVIRGLPEEMRYPVEELKICLDEAQNTQGKMSELNKAKTREALQHLVETRRSFMRNPQGARSQYEEAIASARDRIVTWYSALSQMNRDFLSLLDGLWMLSARAFVQLKNEQIDALKEQTNNTTADSSLPVRLDDSQGGSMSLSNKDFYSKRAQAMVEACQQDQTRRDKVVNTYTERIKRYQQQKAAVWEEEGKIVAKARLVAERKADFEYAQKDEQEARSFKGKQDELIAHYQTMTTAAWEQHKIAQGRHDLEVLLREAQDTLDATLEQIKAINEKEFDTSDVSREGLAALLREDATFTAEKFVGNYFMKLGPKLAQHIRTFKEIKPLANEFERCVRGICALSPELGLFIPCVNMLADRYLPGITRL